jgi:hypothetical protein
VFQICQSPNWIKTVFKIRFENVQKKEIDREVFSRQNNNDGRRTRVQVNLHSLLSQDFKKVPKITSKHATRSNYAKFIEAVKGELNQSTNVITFLRIHVCKSLLTLFYFCVILLPMYVFLIPMWNPFYPWCMDVKQKKYITKNMLKQISLNASVL